MAAMNDQEDKARQGSRVSYQDFCTPGRGGGSPDPLLCFGLFPHTTHHEVFVWPVNHAPSIGGADLRLQLLISSTYAS